jgi:DNA-binding transcriptional LysR family regulator
MHATVLKYFVEVARCGSMRAAAATLFVASSAINRQILKLEDELGTELFDRLPTGMRLNPAGERLLQHVRSTLHDFHVMRSELDALRGERTGHITLAAMDSLFIDFLPAAIDDFCEAYPAVTYTLHAAPPVEVPDRVASGEFDIGITFIGKLPSGLQVVAQAPFPPGVVMAAANPLSKKPEISFDDCHGQPFLRSLGASPIHSVISPDFARFWDALSPAISCNSTPMLKRLISTGKGISFFSRIAFLDEIARGEIVWRPFADPAISQMQAGVIVATHRVLPNVTTDFLERIVRRLKQLEIAAAGLD